MKSKDGWSPFPYGLDQKWHYYRNRQALCGIGKCPEGMNGVEGYDESEMDCEKCREIHKKDLPTI